MAQLIRCTVARFGLMALALGALGACERESRRFEEIAPTSEQTQHAPIPPLHPGEAPAPPGIRNPYEGNAWAINEGKRLYTWFNCVGCHFHGGGGMGPPLMDDRWIYGSEPANIYDTIVQGRPNGMPAYGGKIPDQQLWQIVAYIQSMGRRVSKDVAPGRDESMQVKTPESMKDVEQPHNAPAEHP